MMIKPELLKIKSYIESHIAALWEHVKNTVSNWFRKIKGKKILFWVNILFIFIPPVILAIPFPPYIGIYHIKVAPSEDKPATEVSIPDKVQSLGVPYFSKLSSIEVYSLKTKICLFNRNEVFVDNEKKSKKDLVDGNEAGAMEIKVQYADGTTLPLYAPRDAIRCQPLKDNSAQSIILKNEPLLRNTNPFGQPEILESNDEKTILKIPVHQTFIDPSRTFILVIPDFISKEFFLNLIIFFLAWSLIYIHLLNVGKHIRVLWKWSKIDKF